MAKVTQLGLKPGLGDLRVPLTKARVHFLQQFGEAGKKKKSRLFHIREYMFSDVLLCKTIPSPSGLSFSIYKMGSTEPLTRACVLLSKLPV